MKLQKDLVAASATPLVLSLLQSGDSYGYELIKRIQDLSGGELEWKEGMLYPLLHRLANKGLVETYDKKAPTGRTRKYYRLLPEGRRQLEDQRAGFEAITSMFRSLQTNGHATGGDAHV